MKKIRKIVPLLFLLMFSVIALISCKKEADKASPAPPKSNPDPNEEIPDDVFTYDFTFRTFIPDSTNLDSLIATTYTYTFEQSVSATASSLKQTMDEIELPPITLPHHGPVSGPDGLLLGGAEIDLRVEKNGDFYFGPVIQNSTPLANIPSPLENVLWISGVGFEEYDSNSPLWEMDENLNPVSTENGTSSYNCVFGSKPWPEGLPLEPLSNTFEFSVLTESGDEIAHFKQPFVLHPIEPILGLKVVQVQEQYKVNLKGEEVNPVIEEQNMIPEIIEIEIIRDHYRTKEDCPQDLANLIFFIPNVPGPRQGQVNSTMYDNPFHRAFYINVSGANSLIDITTNGQYVTESTDIEFLAHTKPGYPDPDPNPIFPYTGPLVPTEMQSELKFQYNCDLYHGYVGADNVDEYFEFTFFQTAMSPELEEINPRNRKKFYLKKVKVHLIVNLIDE